MVVSLSSQPETRPCKLTAKTTAQEQKAAPGRLNKIRLSPGKAPDAERGLALQKSSQIQWNVKTGSGCSSVSLPTAQLGTVVSVEKNM